MLQYQMWYQPFGTPVLPMWYHSCGTIHNQHGTTHVTLSATHMVPSTCMQYHPCGTINNPYGIVRGTNHKVLCGTIHVVPTSHVVPTIRLVLPILVPCKPCGTNDKHHKYGYLTNLPLNSCYGGWWGFMHLHFVNPDQASSFNSRQCVLSSIVP